MVKSSYNQKPYRHMLMEAYGANVIPSPSTLTNAGRAALEKYPEHPGTLGLAISEAVEDTVTHPGTHYSLGSVLNHVILHQTIIGEELQKQFALIDVEPDVIYGCVGGGSSFGGVAMPYVRDNLSGKRNVRLVAVEPASCPTLTKGLYAYDYGDEAKMAPVVMMYTLGHDFIPSPIHAGGLRYHGDSPIISSLYHDKVIEAEAFKQMGVFEAAMKFIHTESILPAPESAHAIKAAVDEALRCKENNEEKNICFLLTGHGHFDLAAYDAYLNGKLEDDEYSEEDEARAIASLPKVG
jgi:tryptophan synthase beta chain